MTRFALLLIFLLGILPAHADPICPTTPSPTTSNINCANTAFVQGAITGALAGGGYVVGPATSTTGHLATFADGTGKVLEDGGAPATGNVTGPGSSTTGHLATFADTTGKVIQDGGVPGTVTSVGTNNGLTGGPITGSGIIGRALNEATISATAAATNTFTNTSFAMSGLGATYTLTPVYSSRVHFTIYGNTSNATANDNVQLIFNYGSGTAPAFGAAVVGTQVGTTVTGTSSTANARVPFAITGIITGLAHGTAYWFDLQNAVNAGTGTIQVTGFAAFEF